MNRLVRNLACFVLLAGIVAWAAPASSKTITVTNMSNTAVTLSDLYTFTDDANSQGKKQILKKGDAGDDVVLAGNGGKHNVTVDNNVKSITISWLNSGGKEVETDAAAADFTITEKQLVMFTAPGFPGQFAMVCAAPLGPIPPDGANVNIVGGHISGGLYDWITFYDVTASDGDVARDLNGNPTSPLLDGVAMTVDDHYSIVASTETPGVSPVGVGALALGLLLVAVVVLRRRRVA